jgi:hypothetical protein
MELRYKKFTGPRLSTGIITPRHRGIRTGQGVPGVLNTSNRSLRITCFLHTNGSTGIHMTDLGPSEGTFDTRSSRFLDCLRGLLHQDIEPSLQDKTYPGVLNASNRSLRITCFLHTNGSTGIHATDLGLYEVYGYMFPMYEQVKWRSFRFVFHTVVSNG